MSDEYCITFGISCSEIIGLFKYYDIVTEDFLLYAGNFLEKDFLSHDEYNKSIYKFLSTSYWSKCWEECELKNNGRFIKWKYDKSALKVYHIDIGIICDDNYISIIKDTLIEDKHENL